MGKRPDLSMSLGDTPVTTGGAAMSVTGAAVRGGISIVMVTYHAGQVLFKSLETTLADPQVDELILIDNGSNPDVVERLKAIAKTDPKLRYHDSGGNIGFGRAVNLGVSLAAHDWVCVLNPDAFLRPGCLAGLREAAGKGPRPCIVGARVLNEDMTEQRGARRGEVTPVTTIVSLLRLERALPFLKGYELHLHDRPLPSEPTAVPTISGACFMISKSDFGLLGGFDPAFFLHVEDVDLCWRARQMGGQVLFHPTAEVVHVGHTSLVDPAFVELHKGEGLVYFFKKRANTGWRKTYLFFLTPLILGVSRLRAFRRPRLQNDE